MALVWQETRPLADPITGAWGLPAVYPGWDSSPLHPFAVWFPIKMAAGWLPLVEHSSVSGELDTLTTPSQSLGLFPLSPCGLPRDLGSKQPVYSQIPRHTKQAFQVNFFRHPLFWLEVVHTTLASSLHE